MRWHARTVRAEWRWRSGLKIRLAAGIVSACTGASRPALAFSGARQVQACAIVMKDTTRH